MARFLVCLLLLAVIPTVNPPVEELGVWAVSLAAPTATAQFQAGDPIPAKQQGGTEFVKLLSQRNPGWQIELIGAAHAANGSFETADLSLSLCSQDEKANISVAVKTDTLHYRQLKGRGMSLSTPTKDFPVGEARLVSLLTDEGSRTEFAVFLSRDR